MAQNKTKAQLEAELKTLKGVRASESFVQIALSLIRWGGIVAVVRYAYLAVSALAGQTTLASIGLDVLASVKVSVAIAWGAAAGGAIYGMSQRKLRKDTVERLQRRNQELELKLDPKRTSSRLTERGETRPEDKI